MTTRTRALALAAALAAVPATAAARIETVGADAVRAVLSGRKPGLVVDVRSAEEYDQGHVAGAIGIPAERVKAEAARLPRDPATPLVFYCRGPG